MPSGQTSITSISGKSSPTNSRWASRKSSPGAGRRPRLRCSRASRAGSAPGPSPDHAQLVDARERGRQPVPSAANDRLLPAGDGDVLLLEQVRVSSPTEPSARICTRSSRSSAPPHGPRCATPWPPPDDDAPPAFRSLPVRRHWSRRPQPPTVRLTDPCVLTVGISATNGPDRAVPACYRAPHPTRPTCRRCR